MRVLAPGKVFLTGAYAVLEGAPAVITAVDHYVLADTGVAPTKHVRPEVEAVAKMLHADPPHVDATALETQGRKLGLGSSAAAAVAAVAAILADRGLDIHDPAARGEIFGLARGAHEKIQPRGSSGDVAASTYGGTVIYVRHGEDVEVTSQRLPSNLCVRVLALSRSLRTSDVLDRLSKVRKTPAVSNAMKHLRGAALAGAFAVRHDMPEDFIAACAEHVSALSELGEALSLTLVPSVVHEAQKAIDEDSRWVVLLPSGAGGGDVVLWVSMEPPVGVARARMEGLRMSMLHAAVEARGVHVEASDPFLG